MTPNIQKWVKENRHNYAGNVLEIGSLDVNGNVRQFFTDARTYLGVDVVYGNNVDVCINGHDLDKYFANKEFDTILCLETIEHDSEFWITCANIKKLLRPLGCLILSSPTIDFPIHHQPDYWRFTEQGIRQVMEMCGVEVLKIEHLTDTIGHKSIIALGRRNTE